jgi:AcrR family transcriptional regulator
MADERTVTRRERRIATRKAQILDAAAKVFAEKGFHRATTKEIAEAADVSEGTLYNYFDSKEDLLIGMMARVAEEQLLGEVFRPSQERREPLETPQEQITPQEPMPDARGFLLKMLRWRQNFVRQNKAMLQAILSEMLVNPELRERYNQQLVIPFMSLSEQQIQARIDLGQIRPVDVSLAVRFVTALNLGLLGLLILGDPLLQMEWESDDLVQKLTGFILEGIGAQEKVQKGATG